MGGCFSEDSASNDLPKINFQGPGPSNDAVQKMPSKEYDYLFKVLLIGDSSVGKTSLCTRFTENAFSENFIATLGVDFKIRTLSIENKRVRLQVWDTAGQERFRTITQAFYRGAHGVVLVYDITDRETFANIDRWLEDTNNYAPDDALKMIVGNKCDLFEERAVTTKEGQDFAKLRKVLFLETSAKTCENVDSIFEELGKIFVSKNS